uniref:Putative inorganic phosphate cotransporter n=2 Tax=Melanaphis sacchari TaxID=742174 RepID=A0A2H8TPE6_9HEMI
MFGWESVFYVSGGLGLLWYICWTLLVYDTPAKHPTISIRERIYIENCLGNTIQTRSKPLPIPWKSLIFSKALLINLVTQGGGIWGLFTLTAQAPSYFNFVLGLNIKQTGLWSGIPHFTRWAFSFAFSSMCDRLVKSKRMSMTNVRKMATCFCNILQGLFIWGICYSGCNSMAAIFMLLSATAVNGAISSGALAAVVDIAPNYAGVIQGIIGTVIASLGFISPMVVGYLTLNQQTLSQWCKLFHLSGVICIGTGLIYLFFGTSDIQIWNTYDDSVSNEKELKLIVKKPNSSCVSDT